jgi:hypothetical protein
MAVLVVVGLCGVVFERVALRLEVEGNSMVPTLLPGDRLVFRRVLRPSTLRVGMVVCLDDPRPGEDRRLVKRIVAITNAGAEVAGDNTMASTDSREFGPISLADLRWVLLRRYNRVGQ